MIPWTGGPYGPIVSESDEYEEDQPENEQSPKRMTILRGILIGTSLSIPVLLQASNMSLLTTTQSAITTDIGSYSNASWLATAYLIPMASFAPIAGRLCLIFSPRTCMFTACIILAIGAAITAAASGFASFVLGRAISGLGAAGITTVSINMVLQLSSAKRRGLFLGLVNSGFTLGVLLGSAASGALLPRIGWRAIFGFQSPVALLGGVSIYFAVPGASVIGTEDVDKVSLSRQLARIDYFGAISLTSFLILLFINVASTRISTLLIALAFVLFGLFILIESRYSVDPILPIKLLRSRSLLFACSAQLGLMICRWLVLFYTPVYFIAVQSWTPATAGTTLLPTNVGFAVGGLIVGWLHIRKVKSYYNSCIIIMASFAVSLLVVSRLCTSNSTVAWYMLNIFFNGACTGAALNYTLSHVLYLNLPETHFIVNSLMSTYRGFASSFGSAIGGAIFSRVLIFSLEREFKRRGLVEKHDLFQKLLGSPVLVASAVGGEKEAIIRAFVTAFKVLFIITSAFSLVVTLVQACVGRTPTETERLETSIATNLD